MSPPPFLCVWGGVTQIGGGEGQIKNLLRGTIEIMRTYTIDWNSIIGAFN